MRRWWKHISTVLRSLAFHDEPLPEVINSVSLRDRLTPFINILRRYAGPELVKAIDQNEPLVWQLQGKSLNEVEAMLAPG
jgi:hypothetical protein